ncbi:MAG: ABC transporter permease [Thermomicrobiales bacterium]|nr:ABC transporter permease [Thermomicrobiales bacterium]MCO5223518.1 ABC transporter permease [Thermomicrobiales bacterium]
MAQVTVKPQQQGSGFERAVRRALSIDEIGVIVAMLGICVFLSLTTTTFLTEQNLISVLRQSSYIGIMAVGMVFVISMGDIDLSVGALLMFTSVTMSVLFRDGYHPIVVIVAGLALATFCGFCNGVAAVALRIPMIIVTLGTLSIFRGLGLVITGGSPVSIDREITSGWFFTGLGEKAFGIWMSAWAMFAVALVGWFLFNQTAFGRRVQAIGSNRQAARYSGIRVNRYRIMVMSLMGFIVGIAATFLLAFQRGGNPASGPGQELYVIAATIIGGTALTGGSGSVIGAMIGAIIVWLIQNGLVLLGIEPAWGTVATGSVIIIAVALDYLIKRRD